MRFKMLMLVPTVFINYIGESNTKGYISETLDKLLGHHNYEKAPLTVLESTIASEPTTVLAHTTVPAPTNASEPTTVLAHSTVPAPTTVSVPTTLPALSNKAPLTVPESTIASEPTTVLAHTTVPAPTNVSEPTTVLVHTTVPAPTTVSVPTTLPALLNKDCMEMDTDYLLNDIVPFDQAPVCESWQECSELCRNKYAECKFWTFVGGKCLVKTSNDGKRNKQGSISGSRECGSNAGETGVSERPTNLTDLIEVRTIAESNLEFGQKLYDSVRKEKSAKNLVMSPYSASSVMAMAALGATGITLDEIREGMEFPKKQDLIKGYNNVFKVLRGNKNFMLETANQLFVQEGFQLVKDFVNIMKEKFYSNLTQTNFGDSEAARKLINDWVKHKTNEIIKDLIPEGVLDDLTRLVLVNAIYFKGTWEKKFAKEQTKDDDFHVEEGKVVQVKMMRIIKDKFKMIHLNDLNAEAIEIPYKGQRISMYILLPKNHFGLGDVETKLSETKLSKLFAKVDKAEIKTVNLFLPKFKLEKSITLTDHLKKLGVVQMFKNAADFSGISTDAPLHVKTVIQKASIEVNEEGSEAAAATAELMGFISAVPTFACHHPFMFFIKDKLTHMVLFSGRLMDPTI